MALNASMYSTRTLSLLMLAAFAGVAIWLFAPMGSSGGSGSSDGNGGNANGSLPSSLKDDGAVQVDSHDNVVTRLVVPLAVRGDTGIALPDDHGDLHAVTAM